MRDKADIFIIWLNLWCNLIRKPVEWLWRTGSTEEIFRLHCLSLMSVRATTKCQMLQSIIKFTVSCCRFAHLLCSYSSRLWLLAHLFLLVIRCCARGMMFNAYRQPLIQWNCSGELFQWADTWTYCFMADAMKIELELRFLVTFGIEFLRHFKREVHICCFWVSTRKWSHLNESTPFNNMKRSRREFKMNRK